MQLLELSDFAIPPLLVHLDPPIAHPSPLPCIDHEEVYRQYDFTTENRNLGQFLQAAADAGLFINLRIGPFVCAEWSYGGLPMWLRTGMKFRTNDTAWEHEMETFVTYIAKYVEPYLARNGGPIILGPTPSSLTSTPSPHTGLQSHPRCRSAPLPVAQIENEYDNMEGNDPGNKEYVQWCGALTQKLAIGIPWVMCSSHDAPSYVISTCNGHCSHPPCPAWNPSPASSTAALTSCSCASLYAVRRLLLRWLDRRAREGSSRSAEHVDGERWLHDPPSPAPLTRLILFPDISPLPAPVSQWSGWFYAWGEPKPSRPAQDLAFAVARWFARGGGHMNYYVCPTIHSLFILRPPLLSLVSLC